MVWIVVSEEMRANRIARQKKKNKNKVEYRIYNNNKRFVINYESFNNNNKDSTESTKTIKIPM